MPSWDKIKNKHNERKKKKHKALHNIKKTNDTNSWHCINPTNSTGNNVQHFSFQKCQYVLYKTLEKPNILFGVKRIEMF